MAVPGIGLQSTIQFQPRNANQRGLADAATKNETQTTAPGNSAEKTNNEPSLFNPVVKATQSNQVTTSRRNLAEIESVRNSFQIQKENLKLQGRPAKALQSFLDVADFERKDELTSLVGLDIFV